MTMMTMSLYVSSQTECLDGWSLMNIGALGPWRHLSLAKIWANFRLTKPSSMLPGSQREKNNHENHRICTISITNLWKIVDRRSEFDLWEERNGFEVVGVFISRIFWMKFPHLGLEIFRSKSHPTGLNLRTRTHPVWDATCTTRNDVFLKIEDQGFGHHILAEKRSEKWL